MGEHRTRAVAVRATFKRPRRLPDKAAFDAILRRPAVRVASGPLWLSAVPGSTPTARLGLAVAKRVLRRATMRNRAKRIIRETFRRQTDLPAWDIVVGIARGQPEITMADVHRLFRIARDRFAAESASKAPGRADDS